MTNEFGGVFAGRKVFVTGHTGFKGSWLTLWLVELGAQVAGYSADVPTSPSNFELLNLRDRIQHYEGDVRDRARLAQVFDEFKPDMVFHLAAQALVRRAYADPAGTFETNTLGMVNVLECVRTSPSVQVGVLITSDKAYRNDEVYWGYRETDALGGHDPYSASKGCAELVAHAYFESFLKSGPARVATTRAGNVIGGGDWAADRIVPDCVRAWSKDEVAIVRSPRATRPWQHVLEPLSGYLWLAAHLWNNNVAVNGQAFNFGPDARVNQSVAELLDAMISLWPAAQWDVASNPTHAHEATLLKLSCDKALHHLKWHAALQFNETVDFTVDWYKAWHDGEADMYAKSIQQIADYVAIARKRELPWV